jgi:hypothetical protein
VADVVLFSRDRHGAEEGGQVGRSLIDLIGLLTRVPDAAVSLA